MNASLVVWVIEIVYGKALNKCKLLALSFLCLLTASIVSLRTSLGGQSAHLPFVRPCVHLVSVKKLTQGPKQLFPSLLPCSESDSCTSLAFTSSPPCLCSCCFPSDPCLRLTAMGNTWPSSCLPTLQLLTPDRSSIKPFLILPLEVVCPLPLSHQRKLLLPFFFVLNLSGFHASMKGLLFAQRFPGTRWHAQYFTWSVSFLLHPVKRELFYSCFTQEKLRLKYELLTWGHIAWKW